MTEQTYVETHLFHDMINIALFEKKGFFFFLKAEKVFVLKNCRVFEELFIARNVSFDQAPFEVVDFLDILVSAFFAVPH